MSQMPTHSDIRTPQDLLAAALGQFGRRARKLSAARLRATATVLEQLRCDYCVNGTATPSDAYAFSVRVEQAIRAAIDALTDPADRRIAQAVMASEPEFHDKTVAQRRAYVATHDRGFSEEMFKARRQRVLHEIADGVREALRGGHC